MKEKIIKLLKKIAEGEEIAIKVPRERHFGDYSTNLALVLAKKEKKSPLEIAQKIVKKIPSVDFLEKVEVAAPGFINFTLSKEWLQKQIEEILKQGPKYGSSKLGKGQKVQVEFISANPTGPLTLGNGRGGFFGDTLACVLEKAGYKVQREYYINDTGNQIEALGHSVLKDKKMVYKGKYIDKLARRTKEKDPQKAGEKAAEIILKDYIKKEVAKMGVKFDKWVSEKSLIKSSKVEKAIQKLKRKKLVYEKDKALWFKSKKFGDDQDRVLRRKDGQYTYFASDVAYHLDKFTRVNRAIDFWGADHYGYVKRVKAAMEAFDLSEKLDIIVMQLVRLIKKGKEIKMSKRTGTYVTLSELIDQVGLDVARFFFLMHAPDTHMDFDLELAKERSEKNPVFYVQYAAARCASILRKSEIRNPPKREARRHQSETNSNLLNNPAELHLIKQLLKFPDLVEEIAFDYQVQKLPFYAKELSTSFHDFYEKCRVLDSKSRDLTSARLSLCLACQIVLKNTLSLMGIRAPEKM